MKSVNLNVSKDQQKILTRSLGPTPKSQNRIKNSASLTSFTAVYRAGGPMSERPDILDPLPSDRPDRDDPDRYPPDDIDPIDPDDPDFDDHDIDDPDIDEPDRTRPL